ncbi:MAG TPA: serine/threonine-protein kinase [Gemmataceae bacterium]|nr:serine/threonine-protein kinase [Gemmataceae bacterium]
MIGRIFLGRYQATKLLGEGGMGRVYLARQLDLGRQVVVKVMHEHIASEPKFCERFQRETLLMARFQHPYVVTLYDASLNDPEGACIIMEYIRGASLDALLLKNGRLSAARVGRLLGQLCEALQAAHSEGIIHRDLKPANLMVVDPDTPYEKIKVMDFGLAKILDQSALQQAAITNSEFAVGTPGYMCPEQVRGEEVDQRGDLYSVGVILYELLTGKLPFAGRSSMDILLAHANEEPPRFEDIGASDWVAPDIENVVMACLAKDPADRPACARDLAERFEIALDHEQVVKLKTLPAEDPRAAAPAPARASEWLDDPTAVVRVLEAWMPEKIAAYKLHGFVQDVGGEVIESIPGRIRVLLGGRGSPYMPSGGGPFSWLRRGRRFDQIEMDLHLQQADSQRNNLLQVTVAMRPPNRGYSPDDEWRARCDQIYCDLRGYLMGLSGAVE